MKKKIQPKWYPKAKIICVCGNVMEVGSTEKVQKETVIYL